MTKLGNLTILRLIGSRCLGLGWSKPGTSWNKGLVEGLGVGPAHERLTSIIAMRQKRYQWPEQTQVTVDPAQLMLLMGHFQWQRWNRSTESQSPGTCSPRHGDRRPSDLAERSMGSGISSAVVLDMSLIVGQQPKQVADSYYQCARTAPISTSDDMSYSKLN